MADYPGTALKISIKELLATGLYSDLIIVCGNVEFKVHKFALHTQSPYFRKLLGGNFKEGAANSNVSRLPLDEDPAVFTVLLRHLYHFTYDDSARGNVASALFAVRVYAAADKYDIEPLRKQAAMRLGETLDLKDVQTLTVILRAVEEDTADDVLWDVVIPKLRLNMHALLKDEQFREMLQELSNLTFKLLGLLFEPPSAADARRRAGRGRR